MTKYFAVMEAAGTHLPEVTLHATWEKAFDYATVRAVDHGGHEDYIRANLVQCSYFQIVHWDIMIAPARVLE